MEQPVKQLSRTVMAMVTLFVAMVVYAQTAVDPAKVKKGEELFERRCTGCHRLDETRVGPPLRHVFGRAAAADAAFPYSEALKKSHVKWDEMALDKWLTDTESLVPDNDMAFRVTNGEERGAIIAYLQSVSGK
jgi:cytochrome c